MNWRCVYEPSDDTKLLIEMIEMTTPIIKEYCGKILAAADIGTGGGSIAYKLAESLKARVIATDISPYAVELASRRLKNDQILVARCNSGSCLSRVVDYTAFNPPYLPPHHDDWMLDKYCDGWYTKALTDPDSMHEMCVDATRISRCAIAAIYSSISPHNLERCLKERGFKIVARVEQSFFFEKLVAVVALRGNYEAEASSSRG